MEDLFLTASRLEFRFPTPSGVLSTEDLWKLPLTSSDGRKANLDDIAKALNKQLKESNEEKSFVNPSTAKTNETKMKFDIVLFVIKTKIEERNAADAMAVKKANKQKIMAIIEDKMNKAMADKPVEELMALVNDM